jgi:hypothetical protein
MPRSASSLLVALAGSALVVGSLAVVVVGGGLVAGIGPFAPVSAHGTPGRTAGSGVAGATATPAEGSPEASPSPDPSVDPSPAPSVSPSPAPTASPAPTPRPTAPPAIVLPATGPVEVDLYGRRDFASQANEEMCVSGAMQTMLNVMDVIDDRSTKTAFRIQSLAHKLSPGSGTEPEGWAAGLERMGAGHFRVEVANSRYTAVVRAARAIVLTGRPVGLLVWRGAHSWVMHGFRATADPLTDPKAKITHVYISDPWYPRVSSIWGASRPPDSLVPVAALAEDYLPWRRPTGRYPGKDGKFVMVMPVADA